MIALDIKLDSLFKRFLTWDYCEDKSQIIVFEFIFKSKININEIPRAEFHWLKPSNNWKQ